MTSNVKRTAFDDDDDERRVDDGAEDDAKASARGRRARAHGVGTTARATNARNDDDAGVIRGDYGNERAKTISRREMIEELLEELDSTERALTRASERSARGRASASDDVASEIVVRTRKTTARDDDMEARRSGDDQRGERERDGVVERANAWGTTRTKTRFALAVAACACVALASFQGESAQRRARRMIHQSSLSSMSCDEAFAPARVGTWEGMSLAVADVIAATDHVYILGVEDCWSENVTTRVPSQWAGKSSCVNGKVLDKCSAEHTGVYFDSHYTRVSVSHGLIIKAAKEAGHASVTVMEADATFNDEQDLFAQTVSDAKHLITGPSSAQLGRVELGAPGQSHWNIIRLGFRPHLFEEYEIQKASNGGYVEITTGVLEDVACPEQCECTQIRPDGQLCLLTSSGCDLRSSEMYIASARAYDELLESLFDGTDDTIIDHFVLQNIEHSWIVHPSRTVQKDLDIPVSLQKRVQGVFEHKCLR